MSVRLIVALKRPVDRDIDPCGLALAAGIHSFANRTSSDFIDSNPWLNPLFFSNTAQVLQERREIENEQVARTGLLKTLQNPPHDP